VRGWMGMDQGVTAQEEARKSGWGVRGRRSWSAPPRPAAPHKWRRREGGTRSATKRKRIRRGWAGRATRARELPRPQGGPHGRIAASFSHPPTRHLPIHAPPRSSWCSGSSSSRRARRREGRRRRGGTARGGQTRPARRPAGRGGRRLALFEEEGGVGGRVRVLACNLHSMTVWGVRESMEGVQAVVGGRWGGRRRVGKSERQPDPTSDRKKKRPTPRKRKEARTGRRGAHARLTASSNPGGASPTRAQRVRARRFWRRQEGDGRRRARRRRRRRARIRAASLAVHTRALLSPTSAARKTAPGVRGHSTSTRLRLGEGGMAFLQAHTHTHDAPCEDRRKKARVARRRRRAAGPFNNPAPSPKNHPSAG
jgi:hypothetical protein